MSTPLELRGLQQPFQAEPGQERQQLKTPESADSFSDMLSRAVNSVDETMKTSEQSIQDFAAGKTENVHEVMINMQRAQLSFQMMVEMRNKAIETYQEISRMLI